MGKLPQKPFYLHGGDIDLRTLGSAEIMGIAKENGYAWLLPLVEVKVLEEKEQVIAEAESFLREGI